MWVPVFMLLITAVGLKVLRVGNRLGYEIRCLLEGVDGCSAYVDFSKEIRFFSSGSVFRSWKWIDCFSEYRVVVFVPTAVQTAKIHVAWHIIICVAVVIACATVDAS